MTETLTLDFPATLHEHGWITRSRHVTSEGVISYTRCVVCGVHRVELDGRPV